jgi:hypothetical protein
MNLVNTGRSSSPTGSPTGASPAATAGSATATTPPWKPSGRHSKKEVRHIWGPIGSFTRSELRTILFDYTEVLYNRSRHQASLDDTTSRDLRPKPSSLIYRTTSPHRGNSTGYCAAIKAETPSAMTLTALSLASSMGPPFRQWHGTGPGSWSVGSPSMADPGPPGQGLLIDPGLSSGSSLGASRRLRPPRRCSEVVSSTPARRRR